MHTCETPDAVDQSQRSEEGNIQGPPSVLLSEAHKHGGRTNHCLTFLYIPDAVLQLLLEILKGQGFTFLTLYSYILKPITVPTQHTGNSQYMFVE